MSNLKGKKELQARLRAIGKSFKPIGRVWADETVKAARPKVPVRTGRLRASFRRAGASMKRARVTGHFTQYFIDAGTRPHDIRAKRGALVFQGRRGTVYARKVHHRGIKARPFRRRSAEEGLARTPMADIVISQWNAAGRNAGLK